MLPGTRGEGVKDLQGVLDRLGYLLPKHELDGSYGPHTRKAVQRAQAALGLPVTGRADRATRIAANAACVKQEMEHACKAAQKGELPDITPTLRRAQAVEFEGIGDWFDRDRRAILGHEARVHLTRAEAEAAKGADPFFELNLARFSAGSADPATLGPDFERRVETLRSKLPK
jgi:hypothetical protein